jgi:hypothetical protein
MRPWARWTARMALVVVVSATAGGGVSGIAFAGTGGSGSSASIPLLGIPDDVCGDTSALLGIAAAGCGGGAGVSSGKHRATDGGAGRGVRGSASAGAAGAEHRGAKTGHRRARSASTMFHNPATSGPDSSALRQTFGDTLNAPGLGAGTTDNPASRQAGLGTLPGLAELPSLNGLTSVSAGRGTPGGSTLMPSSALSAADVAGMSSDSFAALAIGALLAGAAALKIASRRARDRKAGIGATI